MRTATNLLVITGGIVPAAISFSSMTDITTLVTVRGVDYLNAFSEAQRRHAEYDRDAHCNSGSAR